ncbi:hypothetical protein K1719_031333 [Acacia pycnantha]|nr:hypothetical protein K1719_031333 [Acacia pycnantha]
MSFNAFFWNVRGASDTSLVRHLRSVCKNPLPSLRILAETKCELESNFLCLKNLGYDSLAFVPSVGRSGGIVAAWKSNLISISVIRKERQFIHLQCFSEETQMFLLTAVYSIPNAPQKHALWRDLVLTSPGLKPSRTEFSLAIFLTWDFLVRNLLGVGLV